jgi:hypothetical protein
MPLQKKTTYLMLKPAFVGLFSAALTAEFRENSKQEAYALHALSQANWFYVRLPSGRVRFYVKRTPKGFTAYEVGQDVAHEVASNSRPHEARNPQRMR